MGIQVTVNARSKTKPQYTVTTVSGGSVTIPANSVAVWVGDDVLSAIGIHGLKKCLQSMRENDWPDGPAYAAIQAGDAIVDYGTTLPVFEEDDIVIMQGAGFVDAYTSNSAHVKRLMELWLENVKDT